MANNFNYDNPDDFSKDEEKWLKFFSIPALLSTIIFGVIGAVLFVPVFTLIGKAYIGGIISLIFASVGFVAVSFEIPVTTELPGAGHIPLVILFRIFLRRLPSNRKIYTKGYGDYENFEDEYEEEYEDSNLERLKNAIRMIFG